MKTTVLTPIRPPRRGDPICSAVPHGADPMAERERVSLEPVAPYCTQPAQGIWEVRDRRGDVWSVRAHPRWAGAWLEVGTEAGG